MKLLHLIVSVPMILMLAFWGIPISLEVYGTNFGFIEKSEWGFYGNDWFLLGYLIPFILLFLIIYNIELLVSKRPTWSRKGLIISEIGAIVFLMVGQFTHWGLNQGGINQVVVLFFAFLFVFLLLITLSQKSSG